MILMDLNYKVRLKNSIYPFTKNNIIFVIKYTSFLDDSIALFFCKNESWHIFLADMGIGADFFYIFTVARC